MNTRDYVHRYHRRGESETAIICMLLFLIFLVACLLVFHVRQELRARQMERKAEEAVEQMNKVFEDFEKELEKEF